MTLVTETVSLLRRTIDILNHYMSLAQDALHSAGERRSMPLRRTVETEAAAKLADIIHVEAVAVAQQNTSGGDAEWIRAGTERLKAEAEKIKAERGRTTAEGETVVKEAERLVAETDRIKMEAERLAKKWRRMHQDGEGENRKGCG